MTISQEHTRTTDGNLFKVERTGGNENIPVLGVFVKNSDGVWVPVTDFTVVSASSSSEINVETLNSYPSDAEFKFKIGYSYPNPPQVSVSDSA